MNISKLNHDERLFFSAVLESMRTCESLSARAVYVRKKLERVQQSRLAKAKESAGDPKNFRTLDRHRAEHYALSLPWDVFEEDVADAIDRLDRMDKSELAGIGGGQ